MSMIELGFYLLCAALAICGWILGSHFRLEWQYRALAAFVGGFFPFVLSAVIWLSSAIRMRNRPPLPTCENGTCRWDAYREGHGLYGV